jgi:hypothetical protein
VEAADGVIDPITPRDEVSHLNRVIASQPHLGVAVTVGLQARDLAVPTSILLDNQLRLVVNAIGATRDHKMIVHGRHLSLWSPTKPAALAP